MPQRSLTAAGSLNYDVSRRRIIGFRATITGKNQITIPAAIVRELQLEPGMQLEFEIDEEHTLIVRPMLTRAERVRQLEGKWAHLFPPGSDPIGDLIREREREDE